MERTGLPIPEADCEHAVAARQGSLESPSLDHREQDLGIAAADEVLAEALKLLSQRRMIVDLTIKCDDESAALGKHRLSPRVGEVNDGEPAMRECNPGVAIAPRTVGVGSTMVQTIRHSADRIQ